MTSIPGRPPPGAVRMLNDEPIHSIGCHCELCVARGMGPSSSHPKRCFCEACETIRDAPSPPRVDAREKSGHPCLCEVDTSGCAAHGPRDYRDSPRGPLAPILDAAIELGRQTPPARLSRTTSDVEMDLAEQVARLRDDIKVMKDRLRARCLAISAGAMVGFAILEVIFRAAELRHFPEFMGAFAVLSALAIGAIYACIASFSRSR